jgi:hypothetical protein
MADEREIFQAAMHRMRAAFCDIRDIGRRDDRERLTGEFFDGYAVVKEMWGTALLKLEVLGCRTPGSRPESVDGGRRTASAPREEPPGEERPGQ